MRPIKFRALAKDGTWRYGAYPRLNVDMGNTIYQMGIFWNSFLSTFRRETLGQWTGLFDKNGKEIYEGDVLSYGKQAFRRVVIWRSPSFGYLDMAGVFCELNRYLNVNDAAEVWGNKFENPELMESK